MNPDHLYPELEILRINIQMRVSDKISDNFYLGSTWRGMLGWELRKLLCPYPRPPNCLECVLQDSCPYFILFEKQTKLPGILDAPRGYILFAPLSAANKELSLEITLIDNCTRFVPAVLQSLARAQGRGLGRIRLPFSIISFSEATPQGITRFDPAKDILSQIKGPFALKEWLLSVKDISSSYRIFLLTPLRLRKEGKYVSSLNLSFMFMTLARRLESLSCVFGKAEPLGKDKWLELKNHFYQLDDMSALMNETSDAMPGIFQNLKWDDYSRFSNRQKKKVPMGGLVGECSFVSELPGLGKWLKCAHLLHVGKGAAMGLGRIERTEGG